MLEKDLKGAVEDYLEYGTNQGAWYADRLNSGEVIEVRGETRRRVKLCRAGTADFFIIRARRYFTNAQIITPEVIFVEAKSAKGRQSSVQKAFKILVEEQGARYEVIRSLEELEAALK